MRPTTVVKRDGQLVPFDVVRIAHAITRAQTAVGIEDAAQAILADTGASATS